MLIRALGPLQVQPDASAAGGDTQPPSLGGPRQRAVLACLIAHAGEPVAASTVVDAVWPDGAPQTAHGSLQAYVSRLRSLVGRERLRHTDGAYTLRLARDELDEWVLRDALTAAEQQPNDDRRLAALRTAVGLWRGQPLGDLGGAVAFSAYAAGLAALHVRAVCVAATSCLGAGTPDLAVDLLCRASIDHPHEENLCVGLMRAHAHAGRPDRALLSYRTLRQRLRDDLGTEPSEHVADIAARIAATNPNARTSVAAHHRQRHSPGVELPVPVGPLVGRRVEVAAICRTLAVSRLTTLTGPPGVGKTRLAVECGWQLASQAPGGVVLVPLEGVRDVHGLHAALMVACGVTAAPGVPPARALHRALCARDATLLVLDCADHLNGDAQDALVALVDAVPSLRLLVTSVAAIGAPDEVVVAVAPLTLPEPDGALMDSEAGRLLMSRAQHAQPGFALTPANESALVDVVRRLDGLPLAVELAAGQLAVLGPAQLRQRLHDRFAVLLAPGTSGRHVSLRAAIGAAWDELSPDAQAALDRLGTVSGPVPLSFAEALLSDLMASGGPTTQAALGVLRRRSLVAMDADGVDVLASVRDYAVDRLRASGTWEDACARHADALVGRLVATSRRGAGPDPGDAARSVRALHKELQAALTRHTGPGLARLGSLAAPWWYRFGNLGDLIELGRRVCMLHDCSDEDAAVVLGHAALAEALSGRDWATARRWGSVAVMRAERSRDARCVSQARLLRGECRSVIADWDGAQQDLDSVEDSPVADARMRALVQLLRLRLEWATGPLPPDEHDALDRRAGAAVDASGDPTLIAQHALMRAQLERHKGHLPQARAAAGRLLLTLEQLDARPLAAVARLLLADTASRQGDWDVAETHARRLLRGGHGLAAPFPRDPREVLARCSAHAGDVESALAVCDDIAADATARGHNALLTVLAVLRSDLLLDRDPELAADALERVDSESLPIWYRLEVALAGAAVHLALGQLEQAMTEWRHASERPRGHPMLLHQVRLAIVAGEIAAVQRRTSDVEAALRRAHRVSHRAGYEMPRWELERARRLELV